MNLIRVTINIIIYKIFISLIRKLSIYIVSIRRLFYYEINSLSIYKKSVRRLNLRK